MNDHGFLAEEIDTSTPHPARMYDYYLGGRDNYESDRKAADRVMELLPDAEAQARGNRAFMHRAVRQVVSDGIRQIIDIGTGIPTSPNTHEVARQIAQDVRVAYVDNDPIVATYAGAKLTNADRTGFALADLRRPRAILEHPVIRQLIDFDQPVAVMLVAVLHFVSDEEDPAGIVATLTEALPRGSHLILSHATADFRTEGIEDAAAVYRSATAQITLRRRAQLLSFLEGYQLLDPGLVQASAWRPEHSLAADAGQHPIVAYGAVGRKG
ncbi:SAM-dependent methyltransferase [Streptomyces sp. NPDC047117]|uniref:SAM-dependent methyltransferase n=1 Tax=unclassified Streptomyces TaxID=2593676 RepID=UPI00340D7085